MIATTERGSMPSQLVPRQRLALSDLSQFTELAAILRRAGTVPPDVIKDEEVIVLLIAAAELGLGPTAAINNMTLVRGKVLIYGDAALALVRASGQLESFQEILEGKDDRRIATCTAKRLGVAQERVQRFSLDDAKRAGLYPPKKDTSPWAKFTDRMLLFRARSWCLRDLFGDILLGLGIYEEYADAIRVEVAGEDTTATIAANEAMPQKPALREAEITQETTEQKQPITTNQVRTISDLKKALVDTLTMEDAKTATWWSAHLKPFDVSTAKSMTFDQAVTLIETLEAEFAAAKK